MCLLVEKRIVFATQPSLCLDASVKVFLVSNLLHYNRSKFNFKRPGLFNRTISSTSCYCHSPQQTSYIKIGISYFGIWNERVMKKNTQLPLLYNPSIISSHQHLLHQSSQPASTAPPPAAVASSQSTAPSCCDFNSLQSAYAIFKRNWIWDRGLVLQVSLNRMTLL